MDETRYEEFIGDGKTMTAPGDQVFTADWWEDIPAWYAGNTPDDGARYRRPIQPATTAINTTPAKGPSPALGSDTPRTDAAAYQPEYLSPSVFVEFARILERENTALKNLDVVKDFAALQSANDSLSRANVELAQRNAALREEVRVLSECIANISRTARPFRRNSAVHDCIYKTAEKALKQSRERLEKV